MYLSGQMHDFEKRLHQLPESTGDLALFCAEYTAYGETPSAETLQRWDREMEKKAWIFNSPTGDFCYQAPPEPNRNFMCLDGFGTEEANGSYIRGADIGGMPAYYKGDESIFFIAGTDWVIVSSSTYLYNAPSSPPIPPTPDLVTNWNTMLGSLPIGTVTAGECT
jgi:hypothetical protein